MSEWMPIDSVPADGTVVEIRAIQTMRWMPYKPNSEQFRKGTKGRWQRLTEHGGWENCATPYGDCWRKAESGEPVKYGCHCELEPGMAPDGCVIDEGRPLDCVYTRQSSKAGIARKEDCEHWRPIK